MRPLASFCTDAGAHTCQLVEQEDSREWHFCVSTADCAPGRGVIDMRVGPDSISTYETL